MLFLHICGGFGAVHHLGVPDQLLEVLGRVKTIRTLVDLHFLVVYITLVVEEMSRVLREVIARGAGVVPFDFALG